MSDTSLLGAQIRAARSLLGWSQSYFADGVRVARSTILELEAGRRKPHPATLTIVLQELAAAGVVLTATGAEFRVYPPPAYVPPGLRTASGRAKRPQRSRLKPPRPPRPFPARS